MKSTNTKWFTLVELIIVITILAILATIAFISFQGYTKDSRNSKRASDLNSISRSIEVKWAEWVSLINFVSGTGARLSAKSLAWGATVTDWTNYEAWDVNFSALGNANPDSFKDPLTGNYKIWVTTLVWGAYQLASIKETESAKEAYVMWTFKARKTTDTGSWTVSNWIITLEKWLWLFKKWDLLNIGTGSWEVDSVSSDLSKITLKSWSTATSGSVALRADETAWLIWSTNPANPVVNGSGATLPY